MNKIIVEKINKLTDFVEHTYQMSIQDTQKVQVELFEIKQLIKQTEKSESVYKKMWEQVKMNLDLRDRLGYKPTIDNILWLMGIFEHKFGISI